MKETQFGTFWIMSMALDFQSDPVLASPIEQRCKIQFSLVIMAIVISSNIVKCVCLLLTLQGNPQPLVILGDGKESFLSRVDPITENTCLAGSDHVTKRPREKLAMTWERYRYGWFLGPSLKRWMTGNIFLV